MDILFVLLMVGLIACVAKFAVPEDKRDKPFVSLHS